MQAQLIADHPRANGNPKYVLIPMRADDTSKAYHVRVEQIHSHSKDSIIISDAISSEQTTMFVTDFANAVASINAKGDGTPANISYIKERHSRSGFPDSMFHHTFIPVLFMFLFVISATSLSGQMLVRSILDERRTKLTDMYLSSMSASEYICGKYAGIALIGVTYTVLWFTVITIASAVLSVHLDITDVALALAAGYLTYMSICGLYTFIAAWSTTESSAIMLMYIVSLFSSMPLVLSNAQSVSSAEWLRIVPWFSLLMDTQQHVFGKHITLLSFATGIITICTLIAMSLIISIHVYRARIQRGL
ncbi:MAG: ABC transporter permease [Candidatus Kapabacteria bacterium]|nr:ABC transporter permease [Candidatus Kapabacteria bacterium]